MRFYLLSCFILFSYSFEGFSQVYTKTIPMCGGSFMIEGEIQQDNATIKVTLRNIDDHNDSRIVTYMDNSGSVTDFSQIFQKHFFMLKNANNSASITCSTYEKNLLLSEGLNLWYQMRSENSQPKAGIISVASNTKLTAKSIDLKTHKRSLYSIPCKVLEVHFEFNNGYIETMYAIVKVGDDKYIYRNFWGIGFSSFGNFKKFSKSSLYELYSRPGLKQKINATKKISNPVILLKDLLNYVPELAVDRRDYSPKDTSLILKGGQTIQLYKQETFKLFEARIYSDFIGLQESKPNGLIQTEVEKKININTRQLYLPIAFIKSVGIFEYIKPVLILSKLEQHNKYLALGNLDSIRQNPGLNDSNLFKNSNHYFATSLGLLQHQTFSGGFDLNIFNLANHDYKFSVHADLGARLGISSVSDSEAVFDQVQQVKTQSINQFTVNTLQFCPQVNCTFLPEERFNLSLTDQMIWIKPFSNNIQLVSFDRNEEKKFSTSPNKWLNMVELLMAIKINPIKDTRVFGRLRFISESNNSQNNFAQVQIGYSTYILANTRNK